MRFSRQHLQWCSQSSSVAVLLMRFWISRNTRYDGCFLGCRSPYEILYSHHRLQKLINDYRVAVLLMRFYFIKISCSAQRVYVAVLLMRFSFLLRHGIFRKINVLPFSLWDSSRNGHVASDHSRVAVLLMRFPSSEHSTGAWTEYCCRSPYEILRTCCSSGQSKVAVLLMRFLSGENSASFQSQTTVAVLLMRFNTPTQRSGSRPTSVAVLLMRFT